MRDLGDYQKRYAEQPYERYQAEFRKKYLIRCLGKYAHDDILEIGCGLTPLFEHYDAYQTMTVVEPADVFYGTTASIKAAKSEKRIELHKDLFENCVGKLAFKPYDFISLSSLLHEVESPETILQCIRQVSDAGTVTHVNVPNANSFHRLWAVESGLIRNVFETSDSQKAFQQQRVFSADSLAELVTRCGFEIIESGSYVVKPFTHAQMQRLIDDEVITVRMLEGLERMTKYMPGLGSEIYVNLKMK